MIIDPRLHGIVAVRPYPLLFATISGAHVLPLDAGVGLEGYVEVIELDSARQLSDNPQAIKRSL